MRERIVVSATESESRSTRTAMRRVITAAAICAIVLGSGFLHAQVPPALRLVEPPPSQAGAANCLQDSPGALSGLGVDPNTAGVIRARQLGLEATTWREISDRSEGTHLRATRLRRDAARCGGLEAVGDVVVVVREGGPSVTMRADRVTVDWNCVPADDGPFASALRQIQDRLWSVDGYCPDSTPFPTDRPGVSVDDHITVTADTFSFDSNTGTMVAEGNTRVRVTRRDGYTISMRAERWTIEPQLGRPDPGSFWDLRPVADRNIP